MDLPNAVMRMELGWRPAFRFGRINPLRGAWVIVAAILMRLDLRRYPVGMLPPWWIQVAFYVRERKRDASPEAHPGAPA